MSIKDILLYLDTTDSGHRAAEFATSLAVRTDAHLTASGVVVDRPPIVVSPSIGGPYGALAALERVTDEERKEIERVGRRLMSEAPPEISTEVVLIEGYRGEACQDFARLARYYDLSVIAQSAPEESHLARQVLAETLFGSGRPVFVTPYIQKGPAKLDRAMICWDGGVQAARALAAALPLLCEARQTEVVVIGKGRTAARGSNTNIAGHLARHGINAVLTELPDAIEAGDAILSYSADSGADFIVMGAYGHWRLTEFVIGGTTRTILNSMTIPVFMAH